MTIQEIQAMLAPSVKLSDTIQLVGKGKTESATLVGVALIEGQAVLQYRSNKVATPRHKPEVTVNGKAGKR